MAVRKAAKTVETKKVETKAAAPVKAAETKAAAPVKEEVKAAPVKEAAKKAPVKKAEPQANVVIQFGGKEIVAKEVLAAATEAFKAANKDTEIKTIELYVKPEENVAYYVVNGEGSDDYKVEL